MEKNRELLPTVLKRSDSRQTVARFACRNGLAVEFSALCIERDAIDTGGIGTGERDVKTAGVAALDWRIAEQNSAFTGGTLKREFENEILVAFVEDEPAPRIGFRRSRNGAGVDPPGSVT